MTREDALTIIVAVLDETFEEKLEIIESAATQILAEFEDNGLYLEAAEPTEDDDGPQDEDDEY